MTPQETIRANPFRHSAYVTAPDEAWIAAHMHRSVRAEQVLRGFTPGALPKAANPMSGRKKIVSPEEARDLLIARQNSAKAAMRRIANDRYADIAKMIGSDSTTYAELAVKLGIKGNSAASVVTELKRRGLVEFAGTRGRSKLYRVVAE